MQTRKESIIEIVSSKLAGMALAILAVHLYSVFHPTVEITLGQNLILTLILSAISMVKNYFWRRYFNRRCKYRCSTCKTCDD